MVIYVLVIVYKNIQNISNPFKSTRHELDLPIENTVLGFAPSLFLRSSWIRPPAGTGSQKTRSISGLSRFKLTCQEPELPGYSQNHAKINSVTSPSTMVYPENRPEYLWLKRKDRRTKLKSRIQRPSAGERNILGGSSLPFSTVFYSASWFQPLKILHIGNYQRRKRMFSSNAHEKYTKPPRSDALDINLIVDR